MVSGLVISPYDHWVMVSGEARRRAIPEKSPKNDDVSGMIATYGGSRIFDFRHDSSRPARDSLKVGREITLWRKPSFRVLPLSKIKHPQPPITPLKYFLIVSACGGNSCLIYADPKC